MRQEWTGARGHNPGKAGQQPVFSIVYEYLRLAGQGEKILGFRADGYYWRDLGTAASLKQAAEDAAGGLVAL
jgi:NDP-sugar pyrophosphorylase family protein